MKPKRCLTFSFVILAVFSAVVVGIGATAGSPKKDTLMKVFSYQPDQREALFAESFLNQVPVEKLNGIIARYKNNLGDLEEVKGEEGQYTLIFEKGTAPSKISLTGEGKIAGLWFGNWTLATDTLDKLVSELKNLKSSVSLYISRDDDPLFSLNGEKRMAVGSSFKLYVLDVLYDKLDSGSWDQVVRLVEENRSLPSGILQDWPPGTPVTAKTLSNLMISRSDNTATDHLIDFVGREYLAKNASSGNRPFLKTREFFELKYGAAPETQKKYLTGDREEKRQILDRIQSLQVDKSEVTTEPTLIQEIEWFFSTKELASIIYDLKGAEEIYINPGLADGSDWYRAGYKGGSEGGVLQYTHLLQKKKGSPIYVVSVTVNNPERSLDSSKITEITSRLISLVKSGEL